MSHDTSSQIHAARAALIREALLRDPHHLALLDEYVRLARAEARREACETLMEQYPNCGGTRCGQTCLCDPRPDAYVPRRLRAAGV
jgi:hypothetical protein